MLVLSSVESDGPCSGEGGVHPWTEDGGREAVRHDRDVREQDDYRRYSAPASD